MKEKKRNETVLNVRVTQEEREAFKLLSESLLGKQSTSRLLRKLIRESLNLGPDLIHAERKDFQEAVKQLTGIARNLNQITAAINSGHFNSINSLTPTYLSRLSSEVDTVKKMLIQFIENTKQRSMRAVEVGS